MEMEYQLKGPYLIIRVGRELDHHQAEHIRRTMEKINREREIRHIIFDFSETTFMDSSGVGMLISRYRDLSMCGALSARRGWVRR